MDHELPQLYGRLKGYLRKFLKRREDIEDVATLAMLKPSPGFF